MTKVRLLTIACGLGLVFAFTFGETRSATAAADPARFTAIETAIDSTIGAFTAASGDLGSKSESFVNAFTQAKQDVVTAADDDAQSDKKHASSALKRAIHKVNGVSFKLRNLHARKTIPSETRLMLLGLVKPIRSDLVQLRKDL